MLNRRGFLAETAAWLVLQRKLGASEVMSRANLLAIHQRLEQRLVAEFGDHPARPKIATALADMRVTLPELSD